MFALPVLTYTQPAAARDALRWRHSTLDLARERAATLGLSGAAFPWRTIHGQECSAYWPAGTAAFHIGADIADAVIRYLDATGDDDFAREVGVELLVETARLWRSLGHHDRHGVFHIDGVTGPDEYSALGDDNVYTNLMAARNLRAAAELALRLPGGGPGPGRDRRGGGLLARRGAAMHVPVRRGAGRARAGPRLHQPPGVGLREHPARAVPAAAALPVLRPVPQAGGEAGRPGAGDALVRRRVHAGAEGPQLRLLRGAYGAGLVAVGLRPRR